MSTNHRLPFLPEELIVGGVPLALLHALSCIQVTSLDEEPEVSGVTLETAKELIQAAQEQLGKPPAPDADSVLDVYKHAQHSILEEAIEALEAAGEEEAGLSIEHMQVSQSYNKEAVQMIEQAVCM